MERTIKQIDYQKLDEILKGIYEHKSRPFITVGRIYNPLYQQEIDYKETDWFDYFQELKLLNLVISLPEKASGAVYISELGIRVHSAGGWLKYQATQRANEEQELSLRIREVNAAEKSSIATWITGIIAFIALIQPYLISYYTDKKTNGELEILKKRIDTLEIHLKTQLKPKGLKH